MEASAKRAKAHADATLCRLVGAPVGKDEE